MAQMTFAVTGSERMEVNGRTVTTAINTTYSGDFNSEEEGREKVISWFGLRKDPRVISWQVKRIQ